jgi:predicted DsbA family dithiol-disulfide isomerase
MAGGAKRLAKAVAALATSTVVQKAVRKAAEDPRVRRKAAEVRKVVAKKARSTGKTLGKRATALARGAGDEVGKRVVRPARKKAGGGIKKLGKIVAG